MAHYVIDSNVVIEAIQDWNLRTNIIYSSINFSAPKKLEIEVTNKKKKILNKTGMRSQEFDRTWQKLKRKISLVNINQSHINRAESILREIGLPLHDKIFFALALYLKCPLWTFEKRYWNDASISNALRSRSIIVVPSLSFE